MTADFKVNEIANFMVQHPNVEQKVSPMVLGILASKAQTIEELRFYYKNLWQILTNK